jgi:hypothetical protein
MTTAQTTSIRELDHRHNDAIEVWVLWDAETDGV